MADTEESCNCGKRPWNPLHPFSHLPDCPILRASVEAMHCKADERTCRGESYCSCQCLKCLDAYLTPVKPKPLVAKSEAPKILGVAMHPFGRHWALSFGKVNVHLSVWDRGKGYQAEVCNSVVCNEGSLADCVAAIERELLAIRAAIPAAGEETS